MKARLILICVILIGLAACDGREPPVGIDPNNLPFDLIVPDNTPVGDFNAVSGVLVFDQMFEQPGDSELVELPTSSFYAQFVANNGAELPQQAFLNDNLLGVHRQSDTLRLSNASNTNLIGSNTWQLVDDGDTSTFVAAALSSIDSVAPFSTEAGDENLVRGDQNLTLRWNSPTTSSAGVRIIWTSATTGNTYVKDAADFGSFTVPAFELQKLGGDGTFIMIRYRSDRHTYKEKSLIITRLAQRRYDVNVVL